MEEPVIILTTYDHLTGNKVGWDSEGNMYVYDPLEINGLGSLGKWQLAKGIKKVVKKVGDTIGKGVRFVNRNINPATILIRNGWLVAMKVNLFNVAKLLRWAYTDYATAKAKTGMSQDHYNKIKKTAHDLEIIYWQVGEREG